MADNNQDWESRKHFFAAASEAMRRILVEGARRRTAAKRGGGRENVEFDEAVHTLPVTDERVLQIHSVLDGLERENPHLAQVVKLRFFVGLNHQEIGQLLDLNEKTARRRWEEAKLLLYQAIKADQES